MGNQRWQDETASSLLSLPLLRNPAQFGLFVEFRGFGLWGAEFSGGIDASGEEVVHQALFDRLILGDQGFGLSDHVVQRRQNPGDLALLGKGWQCNENAL